MAWFSEAANYNGLSPNRRFPMAFLGRIVMASFKITLVTIYG
jgi:hypothetical protein